MAKPRKYDHADLARRWLAGEKCADIAKAMGMPHSNFPSVIARRLGLPRRQRFHQYPCHREGIAPLLRHLRTVDGWSDDRIKRVLGELAA